MRTQAMKAQSLHDRLAGLEAQASQERRDLALRVRHLTDTQRRSWKLVAAGLAVRTILKSGIATRGFRGPLGGLVLLRLGMSVWRRFSRGATGARR